MSRRQVRSLNRVESSLPGLAEALDRADEALGQIVQALGRGADHANNSEWTAFPRRSWRNAINEGLTSLGYWHWVARQRLVELGLA